LVSRVERRFYLNPRERVNIILKFFDRRVRGLRRWNRQNPNLLKRVELRIRL